MPAARQPAKCGEWRGAAQTGNVFGMRASISFIVLGLALAAAPAAVAQVDFEPKGLLPPKPKPALAAPQHYTTLTWPRLDPGAAFCRTEDDLLRRAANASALASGGVASERADCRIINSPTPIEIIERRGPGRTQVRITAGGTTGWTDVWLPQRAPASLPTR
jgi:hypothetical protein